MDDLNDKSNEAPSIPKWQVYTLASIFVLGIFSWIIIWTGVLDEPTTPQTDKKNNGLSVGHGITIEWEPGLKNRISIDDCEFHYARGNPMDVTCTLRNIGGDQYAPIGAYQLIYDALDEDGVIYLSFPLPDRTLYGNDAIKEEFLLKKDVTKIYLYSK